MIQATTLPSILNFYFSVFLQPGFAEALRKGKGNTLLRSNLQSEASS